MNDEQSLPWSFNSEGVYVVQLGLTLCNPMDYSPPGSSAHEILQARTLERVAITSSNRIFLTQGSNPCLLHCRQILYHQTHQGSPTRAKYEEKLQ